MNQDDRKCGTVRQRWHHSSFNAALGVPRTEFGAATRHDVWNRPSNGHRGMSGVVRGPVDVGGGEQRHMLVRNADHRGHPPQEPQLHVFRRHLLDVLPRPGGARVGPRDVPSAGRQRHAHARVVLAGHHVAAVPARGERDFQRVGVCGAVSAIRQLERVGGRGMVPVHRGAVRLPGFFHGPRGVEEGVGNGRCGRHCSGCSGRGCSAGSVPYLGPASPPVPIQRQTGRSGAAAAPGREHQRREGVLVRGALTSDGGIQRRP